MFGISGIGIEEVVIVWTGRGKGRKGAAGLALLVVLGIWLIGYWLICGSEGNGLTPVDDRHLDGRFLVLAAFDLD